MCWRAVASLSTFSVSKVEGTGAQAQIHKYKSAGPGEHALMLPIYVGAIAVNARGERFIDESKSYKLIGDAVLSQPDALGFQVFDQKIFDKGQDGIPTMAFKAKLALGQVITAPTLDEHGPPADDHASSRSRSGSPVTRACLTAPSPPGTCEG